MARVEDLVQGIADPRLRSQLAEEISKLKVRKKFGPRIRRTLAGEEIVQLPGLPVKEGARVAKRAEKAAGFFVVTAEINGRKVSIVPERGGPEETVAKNDLAVVCQHLHLLQRVEDLSIQELVPQL